MKSIFLILFSFVAIGLNAQSLQVRDSLLNDISGDTIYVFADYNEISLNAYAGLINLGNDSMQVNVTRYEDNVLPMTSSFFCWGTCTGVTESGLAPVVTPAANGVSFSPGQSVPANDQGFWFHYDPNFQIGTSLFRVKFFDVNNVNDSTHVYISFTTEDQAGIEELDDLNFYPNPASEVVYFNDIETDYFLFDMCGQEIISGSGTQFSVYNVPKGMYILYTNGISRKLLVE